MQPLLESFESFFYVLVNTLPVGIGIGLVFFGIGFLFTNPRVRRYRDQVANFKEEISRMSRSQAQIAGQHRELLESLQAKENENLLLQNTLETKDEELIGLLDRLNNIAVDSEPASLEAGGEISQENVRLRQRIAELTGRLRTSESALQDRKTELTRARRELARAGVREEATTSAGRSSDDGRWQSEESAASTEALDTPADPPKDRDKKKKKKKREGISLHNAIDALLKQQPGGDKPETELPTDGQPDLLDETASRLFSKEKSTGKKATEKEDSLADQSSASSANSAKTPESPAAPKEPADAPATGPADTDADFDLEAEPAPESGSNELEDQLAEFEQRLRAKEAEFFALQDQLSFGNFSEDDTGAAPKKETPAETAADTKADKAPVSSKVTGKTAPKEDPKKDQQKKAAEDDKGSKKPENKTPEPARSEAAAKAAPPAEKTPSSTAPFPPIAEKPATAVKPSQALAPGEQLLFRGSDPSRWGKDTGAGLVSPGDARKSTKFLRLRRTDTGESVIIRVAKKDLLSTGAAESVIGWNGKGETTEGAHLLGIFDHSLPQEAETRFGAGGWGFGRFCGSREGQAYVWAGLTMPRTEFEISALSKLPDRETLKKTATTFLDTPSIAPSTDDELVFFHSAYPEIWNKNAVDGKGGFAFHLCRTPKKTRFLKVRRPDNYAAVVIPISRDKITHKADGKNSVGWNGSNEFFFAGHHLGIVDPGSARDVEITAGCGGYGFGHLVESNDRQAVAWAGSKIPRTPLEFIAIARDLTAEEKDQLLKP